MKEAIRVRAYFKWLAAGKPDGRSLELWVAAEREHFGFTFTPTAHVRQVQFHGGDTRSREAVSAPAPTI